MKIEPVTLRAARPEDVSEILAMVRELASFESLLHEVTCTAEALHAALFGEGAAAWCWLAETGGGTVAGYVICYQTFSSFTGKSGIFLDDIFVRPQFRRQGIAKKLLRFVASEGRRMGVGRIEWIALEWNSRALDMYAALGAMKMKDWSLWRLPEQARDRLADEAEELL